MYGISKRNLRARVAGVKEKGKSPAQLRDKGLLGAGGRRVVALLSV